MTRDTYSHGYGPRHQRALARRTLETHSAFILPHLHEGLDVLDCGCGPGSLTIDIGERVAPGLVVGIDREEQQLELARRLARERRIENVRFEVGDVCQLAFPSASFDLVFAHAVLEHVREPGAALRELRRVLRPNGMIAIRDLDNSSLRLSPCTPALRAYWDMHLRIFEHNGASHSYAVHQRRLLREAGFASPETTATVDYVGTPEATRLAAASVVAQLQEPSFAGVALAQGWVTEADLETMAQACTEWGESPDAFAAVIWCQSIAWNAP